MPLTCGVCPVSSKEPGVPYVWCDSMRMAMAKVAACGYQNVAQMLEWANWHEDLAGRLRKAAEMREAEMREREEAQR